MVERRTENPYVVGSIPTGGTKPTPKRRELFLAFYFINLIFWCHSQAVRPRSAKPLSPVRIWVAPPKNPRSSERGFFYPLRKQWHIINDSDAIVVSYQSVRTVYHHALACIKNFRNDVKNLIDWHGGNGEGCLVSDMITKEGYKVGYMYREIPDDNVPDSRWRFFAGNEDEEYSNSPNNIHIFAINTVCNYDSDIIPYLNAEYDTSFIRIDDSKFVQNDGTKHIFLTKQK